MEEQHFQLINKLDLHLQSRRFQILFQIFYNNQQLVTINQNNSKLFSLLFLDYHQIFHSFQLSSSTFQPLILMGHYSIKLVKFPKHFIQNIMLNQLLQGTHQSNNSIKKINHFENYVHTFDGFAIIPLTRIYTVNSYGTSPPSATIFLIRSPSFEPYLKV